ncbi:MULTISPECIES: M48 family metallopeptidase [Roseivirga]|jgi:predicted Zn-dependent protease|uniref:M48 family metallopeptidase n=1 Tax=Roseivirga TaxID=290180 RepID=UPI000D7AB95C|nr:MULTISPECIES: M48 family metallopeptidase [Roseivirga]MBO6496938.1 M48 family metallopeptidase [Roseivirga sp.]PWL28499.1 MAG: peptidase M48 [Roseivirga sp. XM-24bin3]WPZ10136.1 M48 family metallopeptidase [Roseivirga spongicola]
MKTIYKWRVALLIFLSAVAVWACTTVPITGRSQLTGLIGDQQVVAMSAEAYRDVIDSVRISNNEEQTAMVRRVGFRIKDAIEEYLSNNGQSSLLDGFDWEFNLIENDTMINAWAMPGGKVAFYTGILPVCQDELGVAVVMGHEVAHAVAKHGQERMNTAYAQQIGLSLGSVALGQDPTMAQQLVFQAVGLGSQLGMLAFSRKHESEADELGLIFMAIAGYDPREAPKFWERMSSNGGGAPPEFLSTHPSHSTRISDLNAQMAKAVEYYQNSKMR